MGWGRGYSKCTCGSGGHYLDLHVMVEREDCLYVNKSCKTVVKVIMKNNSIYYLSHHKVINKVLCVDQSAMLVLAMDSEENSKSTLLHPSTEVNV